MPSLNEGKIGIQALNRPTARLWHDPFIKGAGVMTMRIATLSIIAATVLSAAACSTTPSASASERQAREVAALARYQAAAGAPVSSIRIYGSPSLDTVDGSHIVYALSPARQYLITLGGNCMDWATGPSVGISSSLGRINTKFDSVHTSLGLTCEIKQIQPLDTGKLKSMPEGETRAI